MHFEGSEKKFEITFGGNANLLELPQEFWNNIVIKSQASILSCVKNDEIHAYLLSESSLFVMKNRVVMITCGGTVLVDALFEVVRELESLEIEALIFKRKNEYLPQFQKTSFFEDVTKLKDHFDGAAIRFGDLDGHHNFIFHLNKDFSVKECDQTSELLMYHIQGKAKEFLKSGKQNIPGLLNLLNLEAKLPGFEFDDYTFEPCGYSLNGIKEDRYLTIHITPQECSSYVSFETNLNLKNDHPGLFQHFIQCFSPMTFDLIHFDDEIPLDLNEYICLHDAEDSLACGYNVYFKNYSRKAIRKKKAVTL